MVPLAFQLFVSFSPMIAMYIVRDIHGFGPVIFMTFDKDISVYEFRLSILSDYVRNIYGEIGRLLLSEKSRPHKP